MRSRSNRGISETLVLWVASLLIAAFVSVVIAASLFCTHHEECDSPLEW